jgi:hypothetical protein
MALCELSISVVDPNSYPDSMVSLLPRSGSGSRREKMTQKNRKQLIIVSFEVLDVLF